MQLPDAAAHELEGAILLVFLVGLVFGVRWADRRPSAGEVKQKLLDDIANEDEV